VNRPGGIDEEAARITREVTERAIRRLDVLEWVILAGAVLFAVIGGWMVAVLLGIVDPVRSTGSLRSATDAPRGAGTTTKHGKRNDRWLTKRG
jgi:hypothetical protein